MRSGLRVDKCNLFYPLLFYILQLKVMHFNCIILSVNVSTYFCRLLSHLLVFWRNVGDYCWRIGRKHNIHLRCWFLNGRFLECTVLTYVRHEPPACSCGSWMVKCFVLQIPISAEIFIGGFPRITSKPSCLSRVSLRFSQTSRQTSSL